MRGKIKDFVENILSNLISSILLSVLIGLGTSLVILWSSIKSLIISSEGNTIPLGYWIIFTIGLAVAMVCIVLTIYSIIVKVNKPQFPRIQSDIRCESAISELYFESREEIKCSREVYLEVICEEINSIKKQFTWTGTEYKCTILEESDKGCSLRDYQRKKPPHGYELDFDEPRHRGEKIHYKTKTEVSDMGHEMKPFFSHLVKSPTDELEIRITAPKGLLKNVRYTICADTLGEIPISSPEHIKAKPIGNLETFSRKIDKPNLLYNYRLDWTF